MWKIIAEASTPPPALTPWPIHWVPRAICTRIKRPAREADPACSSYEAKNQCTYNSTPHHLLSSTLLPLRLYSETLFVCPSPSCSWKIRRPFHWYRTARQDSADCSHAVQMILPLLAHPHVFTYICNYRTARQDSADSSHAGQMILPLLVQPHVFTCICNYRALSNTKISLVVSSVAKPPGGPKQRIYLSDLWNSFWHRTKIWCRNKELAATAMKPSLVRRSSAGFVSNCVWSRDLNSEAASARVGLLGH